MIYRGHVKNGQIALDVSAELLEGAVVTIEVIEVPEHSPRAPQRRRDFQPIVMPGGPLADDIIRERR